MSKFIRKDLKNFKPYTASKTLEQISKEVGIPAEKIIKLDSSENPFMEGLQNKSSIRNVNFYLYPDPLCLKLREKLGKYAGVKTEQIVCGNGSDELVDLIIRSFVNNNEEIIICPPTFVMYEFYAKLSGVKVKTIIRKENFKIDLLNILKSITPKTKLIIIDSPGNPTGDITSLPVLEKILKKGCLVISDEAYFEYCGKTAIPLLKKYPNLIILRSLSKWSGLAGLRVGYAIASKEIINVILSLKPPYNVSSLSQYFAESFLEYSNVALQKVKKITEGRNLLVQKLLTLKEITVYPNEGAYILIKPNRGFDKLVKYLTKRGVLVKMLSQPLLENCIRISLPLPSQINQIYSIFKEFYKKNIDGIIFDMDGVLVDETESYLRAIVKTVNYLLKQSGGNIAATLKDVVELKKLPGFNDDWDTAYILIELLRRKIPRKVFYKQSIAPSKKIRGTENFKALREIFQMFYLGSVLFEEIENKKPLWENEDGLIYKEKLLISKQVLEKIKQSFPLGIATGRPKKEAEFTLSFLGLSDYFDKNMLVAREDAIFEKPHPAPLLEAKKRLKSKNPIYVGDSISDTIAAKKASMPCIFVGSTKLGDIQISDVNKLVKFINMEVN